jgi:hypothetical protein
MSFTAGFSHDGARARLARELQAGLFEVVGIQVAVAAGPHEFAGLQVADLRHHQREQGVGGDVERHAEEDVGAALVELAGLSRPSAT